jgi:hypothetical protein
MRKARASCQGCHGEGGPARIVLIKRVVWFDGPGAASSFNHAWYLWDA